MADLMETQSSGFRLRSIGDGGPAIALRSIGGSKGLGISPEMR